MKKAKKIGVFLLIILVIMQLVQPEKNVSDGIAATDISNVYALPDGVHKIFVKKCYDCHSNNTHYPWYAHVQPIGWWLAAHVHEGKEHFNFSTFKDLPPNKAAHQLEELAEVIEERSMPLKAYTLLHAGTELTAEDEQAIKAWLASIEVESH